MKLSIKGLISSSVFVFGLTFSITAFAEENTEPERFYDPEFDAEITAYEKTESGLVPLTEEQYREFTQEKELEESEEPEYPETESNLNSLKTASSGASTQDASTQAYYEYWRYSESKVTTYVGNPIQVSSKIICNTSRGCSITKSVTSTVSSSFSVSGQAEKDAIKAGVSYTWVSMASDSTTYSFNLKNGESGYIAFRPTKKKSSGKLKYYSNWDGYLFSKSAYCRNPVKLRTGEAKGAFIFVHKK